MVLGLGKKQAAKNDLEGGGYGNDGRDGDHLGKPTTAAGRSLLLVSQLLAGLGIIILLVGTALLQHRFNHTKIPAVSTTSGSYINNLQSSHWTPYPNSHRRQWQLLWWIIAGSTFLMLLTMALLLRAVRVVQWRPSLVGLHIYFLALCTFAIDAFLWLDNNSGVTNPYFNHNHIRTVLAGLFTLAGADALAVIALGMLYNTRHIDNRHLAGRSHTAAAGPRVVDAPASGEAPVPQQREFAGTPGDHPVTAHQGASYPTQGSTGTTGNLRTNY